MKKDRIVKWIPRFFAYLLIMGETLILVHAGQLLPVMGIIAGICLLLLVEELSEEK